MSASIAFPSIAASDILHRETRGPWALIFFAQMTAGESCIYGVQISLGSEPKARSTVSRSTLTDEQALSLLRSRAMGWIADYEARDHTGTTDFADL